MKKLFFYIFLSSISLIAKAQEPGWLWAIGDADEWYEIHGSASDMQGNTYVAGQFRDSANFDGIRVYGEGGYDMSVVKHDSLGAVVWVRTAGGIDEDGSSCITTDAAGNVYIAGGFHSPSITFDTITLINAGGTLGVTDIFVVKYDQDGNVLWAKSAGGTYGELVHTITVDALGNTLVAGTYNYSFIYDTTHLLASGAPGNMFVAKYDTDGNVIWAQYLPSGSSDISIEGNVPSCITTDMSGNVYIAGTYIHSYASYENTYSLVKYNSDGNLIWEKGNETGGTISGMTIDAHNNIYLTGGFKYTATFGSDSLSYPTTFPSYTFFLAKYDTSGSAIWAKQSWGGIVGGVGYTSSFGKSVQTDTDGNIYVTGKCDAWQITFDTISFYHDGYMTGFVAEYTASGNIIWTKIIHGGQGSNLSLDSNADISISGNIITPNAFFDADTVTGKPYFVAKLSRSVSSPSRNCFSHFTASYDSISNNYTLTVDSATAAVATSYYWTFGDWISTSTLSAPTHVYTTMGAYNLCMKTTTATGDTCTYCHPVEGDIYSTSGFTLTVLPHDTVIPPPPPCFAGYTTVYDSTSDNFKLTVDTATTGMATSYHWDFGDGNVSSLHIPSHVYAIGGSYNICLKIHTATGDSCTYCSLLEGDDGFTINVNDTILPLCFAGFTTVYDSISDNYILTVDSTAVSLATSFLWYFGDGSTSSLPVPSHVYSTGALYNVCLEIHTATGDSCTYCSLLEGDAGFTINVTDSTSGIHQFTANESSISILPNPSTGIFQIAMDKEVLKSTAQLAIYNIVGENIYIKNGKQLNTNTTIDLSDQPNGIYFIQLRAENGFVTKKMIVNK